MCGIFLHIYSGEDCTFIDSRIKEAICNRGPNSFKQIENNINSNWKFKALGSVLWTQGDKVNVQPITNNVGSFLLWNGDVYSGLPNSNETCDSQILFNQFQRDGLLEVLTRICGPYAFIYYDAINKVLWFGRDPVGRHSLLYSTTSNSILISSVASRMTQVEEVPSCGIMKIDLSKKVIDIQLHPWSHIVIGGLQEAHRCTSEEPLRHFSFTSSLQYDWYNREPKQKEIVLFADFTKITEAEVIFEQLISSQLFCKTIDKIKYLLLESIKKRIYTKPDYCRDCIESMRKCHHAKIAILFSGGLDSTILALAVDKLLPANEPIDLYNVAFDLKVSTSDNAQFFVPDRKNALESLKDLKQLAPTRIWNLVQINVIKEELEELRKNHIADLIFPLTTILDDSLGCALWFAARGQGLLNGLPYISPSRIVLLGMGADEIFGGYSRHKKAYDKQGWSGLGVKLVEEVMNIGRRNLGRDNRVVTDHGRQPRTPFLDEDFLCFANSLPPWERCCLMANLPHGVGDKVVLRCLAWQLGLRYCTALPKKALQFGSKIANSKEKGHEQSNRLL